MHVFRCMGVIALLVAITGCGQDTAVDHLDRARDYRSEGELNAAVIELKNALQMDPSLAEARFALGEVYLDLGDLEPALKELERALDLGITADRALPPLLETKLDLGRVQEVLGALETVELTPRLLALRGQALLVSGDVDAARTDLDAALARDAALPRAYLALAQIARSAPISDSEGAIAILNRGVAAVPSSRRLWLVLGELELNRQAAEPAAKAFEKAQALPGVNFLPELGLARVRLLENKPDEAEKLVDGVIARAPQQPLANHLKGVIALTRQDFGAAERAFETVLSVAPDYAPALLALAHVKHAQQQPNQAEAYLRQALARDVDNLGIRRALAGLLLETGNAGGAIEALEPVRGKLTEGRDLVLLGTAYLRAGRLDEASRALGSAATALPDSPEVKTQLALSLAAAGNNAAALEQLDAVVPSADTGVQSEVLRILIQLRSRELDAALESAERLVASGQTNPLAYNLLGAVQVARQDPAAARKAFEAALVADPKFGPAAMNLARLDQAAGKPADARKHLEESLAADPSDVGVLMGLAQLVLTAGEADKAAELLQQAREADPKALAPRVSLARLALQRGDLRLAEAVSVEAEGVGGSNPDVLLLRAQITARTGRGEALARYLDGLQAYLAAAPANAAAYQLAVGELQRQAGRLDASRANLTAALSIANQEVPALVALAQLETAADDLDAARGYRLRLAEKQVNAAVLAEIDGDMAAREKELESATLHYQEAASAGSRSATTKLARVQMQRGQPKEAAATLETWIAAHPNDLAAAMLLASVRLESGDRAGARSDYEALLARQVDNAIVLNNLAWLYFDARDARAEATARKALEAAPKNMAIHDTLGWILAHSEAPGAAAESVTLLQKAVNANPDDPTLLYHLAFAQQQAGRRQEAVRAIERALRVETFAEREAAELLAASLKADG